MSTPLWKPIGLRLIGLAMIVAAGVAAADVVVVVSAKNPVTTLSKTQVADMFLGRTNHFPDGSQCVPVDQEEGMAARDEFYLKFTGKSPAQLKMYWSKMIFTGRGQPPHDVANSVEVRKHIVGRLDSIGYIERKMVDEKVKVLLVE